MCLIIGCMYCLPTNHDISTNSLSYVVYIPNSTRNTEMATPRNTLSLSISGKSSMSSQKSIRKSS